MRLLQQLLSAQDFADLLAEERIEPRGEWRADLRSGIQAAAAVAPWSKRKVSAEDFMPKFGPPERQSPEEMLALVHAAALSRGWKVEGGK